MFYFSFSGFASAVSVASDSVDAWSSASFASSSELITLHTLAITSFFFERLIRRTPCVARPITRQSLTARRMAMPLLLMIMRSLSSVTFLIATSRPVFSVIENVFRSEGRRVGKECRSRWSLYH